MPRVLTICRNLSTPTGTLAGVTALSRAFRERGWDVVLAGEPPASDIAERTGAAVFTVRRSPWLRGYRQRRYLAWRFGRVARGRRFDLVIGHGDARDQDLLFLHNLIHRASEYVPGGTAGKVASAGRFHAELLRERRFRLCLANSRLMQDDIVARFQIPHGSTRVLYPGYDPARFRPGDGSAVRIELCQRLSAPEEAVLVGLITSGDLRKRGADLLLEAFARLDAPLRARARLVIVGKDRTRPYEERAAALGIGSSVLFIEPRPAVEELYRALDLMIHPARIEEFGVVIQEALACGLPVLTSDRTGAAELLDSSLLLPDIEPATLSEHLGRMIARPESRREWVARGLAGVAHNTWEHYIKTFFEYLEITNRQSSISGSR